MRVKTGRHPVHTRILSLLLVASLSLLLALLASPWLGVAAPGRRAAAAAPTGVTVTRYGDSFLVAWSPVDDPQVAGYNVYRTFFPYSFFTRWGRLNQTPVSGTSYLDDGVYVWWLTQYYWVAAVDANGNVLGMSGSVAMDPRIPDTSPPATPLNVEVKYVDSLSINWEYTNDEPDFAGFNLYLYPGGAEPAVKMNSIPVMGDFFYYEGGQIEDAVAVRSVDTSGNESASTPVAAISAAEYVTEFEQPPVYPYTSIAFEGDWARELYPSAHGGQIWACSNTGAAVEVTFDVASNGSKLTLYSARYWQCGSCQVTVVDEATQAVVFSGTFSLFYDNLDSWEPDWGFEVCKVTALMEGTYTLRVENLGVPGLTAWPQEWLDYWDEYGIPVPPFPHLIDVDYLVLKG